MKKIISRALTGLLGIGVVLFVITAYTGTKLDNESKAYVDRIVPLLVRTWDPKVFLGEVSPELLRSVSERTITPIFKMFAEKLGKYRGYKGSDGEAAVSLFQRGKDVTAAYVAEAIFEKGKGSVKITVIKRGGEWKIREFSISPQMLTR